MPQITSNGTLNIDYITYASESHLGTFYKDNFYYVIKVTSSFNTKQCILYFRKVTILENGTLSGTNLQSYIFPYLYPEGGMSIYANIIGKSENLIFLNVCQCSKVRDTSSGGGDFDYTCVGLIYNIEANTFTKTSNFISFRKLNLYSIKNLPCQNDFLLREEDIFDTCLLFFRYQYMDTQYTDGEYHILKIVGSSIISTKIISVSQIIDALGYVNCSYYFKDNKIYMPLDPKAKNYTNLSPAFLNLSTNSFTFYMTYPLVWVDNYAMGFYRIKIGDKYRIIGNSSFANGAIELVNTEKFVCDFDIFNLQEILPTNLYKYCNTKSASDLLMNPIFFYIEKYNKIFCSFMQQYVNSGAPLKPNDNFTIMWYFCYQIPIPKVKCKFQFDQDIYTDKSFLEETKILAGVETDNDTTKNYYCKLSTISGYIIIL